MAVTSDASTLWKGTLAAGAGAVALESSGAEPLEVTWAARSEGSTSVTTPEELIAAAHSACFSMALAQALTDNGTPPDFVNATASVTFAPGVGITGSHLNVNAAADGLDADAFQRLAADAKSNCPVSRALAGVEITLEATLA